MAYQIPRFRRGIGGEVPILFFMDAKTFLKQYSPVFARV